ncbi:MAG TPA: class E sortase [Mycobacteriales bacterium]|nr:class E sortase [Mycobacteriales bacterium]
MSRADTARAAARGLGEFLLTAGFVILLFVAYELWFTGFYTAQQQHDLRNQLQHEWALPVPRSGPGIQEVALGQGVAILRIPRLGSDYVKVVVEGVNHDDLKKGPGHYPGTAMPGQIGNFVVSGHRTTYGAPFNRLDELQVNDAIVVETRTMWFTYHVTSKEVVLPTDIDVIAPVPDHPGQKPTKAYLTFTTCHPKYSASHRLIVHGILVDAKPKVDGLPVALGG